MREIFKITALFVAALLMTTSAAAQEQTADDSAAAQPKTAFTPTADTTPDHLWEQANEAYINGDFGEAAALYERILAQGLQSAKLCYNMANACFRNGETARAILYYNRALRLAPSDDDVRYNLAVAQSLTKDHIEEVPEFFLNGFMRSVRDMLSERVWTLLSVLMFAAALGLGLLFLLAQGTGARKGGFYGMAAALLLFVAATSFAASQRKVMTAREGAIVMSTAAPVKSSPDRSATDLFVLHEGTKVRIVGTFDNWCEVVIADGKKGWIEDDKIERI